MRKRLVSCVVYAMAIGTLFQVSCSIDDHCGKGFKYKDHSCIKLSKGKDASAPSKDASTEKEGGDTDGGTAAPTGLGEICTDQAQCAQYEASYCIVNIATKEGICTIQNCTDNCPGDFVCCKLPEAYGGPVCLEAAASEQMSQLGIECVK
jgi:hypothetical protein